MGARGGEVGDGHKEQTTCVRLTAKGENADLRRLSTRDRTYTSKTLATEDPERTQKLPAHCKNATYTYPYVRKSSRKVGVADAVLSVEAEL